MDWAECCWPSGSGSVSGDKDCIRGSSQGVQARDYPPVGRVEGHAVGQLRMRLQRLVVSDAPFLVGSRAGQNSKQSRVWTKADHSANSCSRVPHPHPFHHSHNIRGAFASADDILDLCQMWGPSRKEIPVLVLRRSRSCVVSPGPREGPGLFHELCDPGQVTQDFGTFPSSVQTVTGLPPRVGWGRNYT